MTIDSQIKRVPIWELPPHLRPTLGFNNDPLLPVRTAGVLPFFVTENREIFVLMQCKTSNGLHEDFGGKVDYDDKTLIETASREAHEESNGILHQSDIEKTISEDFCEYYRRGKYCVFFIEINPIHPSAFGDRENHDQVLRTCKWVKLENVRRYNLNPRLRYSSFDTRLKELVFGKK
jgi:hypothetical protein